MIVFSFFAPIATSMLPPNGSQWYNWGIVACFLWVPTAPIIFIMFSAVAKIGLGKRINARTLSYIYTMTIMASLSTGALGGFPLGFYNIPMVADRFLNPERAQQFWPWFMAPRQEVAHQILLGGVPIPWAEWIPTIIFWGAWWAIYGLFFLALTSILRREWLDMERIPFPHTMVAHELITKVVGEGSKSRFDRLFVIGALLGILWQAPLFMTVMFPWFPDIYGWRVNTCRTGAEYITGGTSIAQIVGLATFNKNPVMGAVFYMAPMSVLLSAIVGFVFFLVTNQAAYALGYYTGIIDVSGCGRVWCPGTAIVFRDPFKWEAMITCGMGAGIAIFYFVIHSRYIRETLRAAFGKMSGEERNQLEKDEAISYRSSYVILISSFVLLMAFFMACGLSPVTAFSLILTSFLFVFASSRVYSLVGFMAPTIDIGGVVYNKFLSLPTVPTPMTSEFIVATNFAATIANGPFYGAGGTFQSGFPAFRMGSLTGTPNKDTFKIVLVTCIVAPVTALTGYIWAMYAFGLQKLPFGSTFIYSAMDTWSNVDRYASMPALPPFTAQFIVGILIAGALTYLHSRFVWFPLEPVGFYLGTDYNVWLEGCWSMFLAAWVLKAITLRIGGSKLYERVGIPLATSFVIGFAGVTFLGSIFLLYRFFFPF
jgi:hypothetical protein